MVEIAREKCIGCGACVKDCIRQVLEIEEGKAKLVKQCTLLCGHCVAVCPKQAVSIPEFDMADVEEYDAETFRLPPEHVLHAVKFRRSIRRFKPDQIEPEKLLRVLQAGRYTPTAGNRQIESYLVLQKELPAFRKIIWESWPRVVERLRSQGDTTADRKMLHYQRYMADPAHADRLFLGAPVLIFTFGFMPFDSGLACANMETMATAEGLGVLYDFYVLQALLESPEAQAWLGLDGRMPDGCMLLGYPDVTYLRTAPRKPLQATFR